MASSLPTVNISDHDTMEADDHMDISPSSSSSLLPPPRATLSVPAPIKSNIGINNPAQGGLFPLPNSQQVAGSKRTKVALGKGFSLMDWIRLTKSGTDLTGVGGPRVNGKIREVTRQELRKHRKRKDAWMAINGAVFNVTHYMDYHPGGWDELIRGAGKDATDMFNEIHKWVNYQGLLEACLVGKLVDTPSEPVPVVEKTFLPPPSVLPPIPAKPAIPTTDFFQTSQKITINIYTKRKGLSKENIIVDNTSVAVRISIFLPDNEGFVYNMHLNKPVESSAILRVGSSSGKVEIDLTKIEADRWQGIGAPLDQHLWFGKLKDMPIVYRSWTVSSNSSSNHNTRHLVLDPPSETIFSVPIGHHIHISREIEGMEISRSYTPVPLLAQSSTTTSPQSLNLLIKVYPDGALTPKLESLTPGDIVRVSDHTGNFSLSQLKSRRQILLLAAGTGVTPIFSLLPHISKTAPGVKVTLLNFNRTQEDIIWRKELDEFKFANSWLTIVHVLSEEVGTWDGPRGRISRQLLEQNLDDIKEGRFAAVCGPKGFTEESDRLLREEFDFKNEEIHLFQG